MSGEGCQGLDVAVLDCRLYNTVHLLPSGGVRSGTWTLPRCSVSRVVGCIDWEQWGQAGWPRKAQVTVALAVRTAWREKQSDGDTEVER